MNLCIALLDSFGDFICSQTHTFQSSIDQSASMLSEKLLRKLLSHKMLTKSSVLGCWLELEYLLEQVW